MRKSATKQLPALQWNILSRSSKPLDWAWVGGVVLVSGLVGGLLGAKYIGLGLILYVFVFCMALRRQIRVNYPAEEGAVHQLGGGQFNLSACSRLKLAIAGGTIFSVLFILAQLIFIFIPEHIVTVSTLTTVAFCVVFGLLRYRLMFMTCFGGGKLLPDSYKRLQRMVGKRRPDGSLSALRLWCSTFLFLLLWAGMCYAYVRGQLGGEHFFGRGAGLQGYLVGGDGLATIFLPAVIHVFVLDILAVVLRGWGEYYHG